MVRELIAPPRLVPGDVIAVVSPSAGLAGRYPHRMSRGVKALESLGFTVEVMPHARADRSWVSGTISERVDDLHAAFTDDRVRAIIATVGGDHSAQLLHALDFDLIRRNPKVICGYSDITSVLHAIHRVTGMITFYGPAVLPQFGEWPVPLPASVAHFRHVTQGGQPVGELPSFDEVITEFVDWKEDEGRPRRRDLATGRRIIRHGTVRGPLLPGCLPTIRHLIGTPWQLCYAGSVLVLDIPDLGYSIATADADLWHLRNTGILGELAGLVVGRPRFSEAADVDRLCQVVEEVTRPFGYPVVAQFECGHCDPVLTLPIGVAVELDSARLAVPEPAVR
jgi:muramoyltetrapeptide carboxypeptidase